MLVAGGFPGASCRSGWRSWEVKVESSMGVGERLRRYLFPPPGNALSSPYSHTTSLACCL